MNIIERIDRPCEYVEVAQTALIACQYLYLWLFAGPDDAYKVWAFCICIWAFNAGGGLYNHHSLPCNCAQQNAFRFFQCQ